MEKAPNILIHEIYESIQGESSFAGLPCVFIRTTGCPLRCRWCDTVDAFEDGESIAIDEVVEKIHEYGPKLVELTGGEPLSQDAAIPLLQSLVQQNFTVLLETGGSEPIREVPPQVHVIMDIKCPGSNMHEKNLWENIAHLQPHHEVKFVIAGRDDFDWAVRVLKNYELADRCRVLFSPAFGLQKPDELVAWMLEGRVPARLNLQLHKYIWSPRKKGV